MTEYLFLSNSLSFNCGPAAAAVIARTINQSVRKSSGSRSLVGEWFSPKADFKYIFSDFVKNSN